MNVLDLFSGIGGFSLGLERAGMRTVAFCEINPFCRAVLKKRWPSVPCYHDIADLTADRLRADGIATDIICGGFPCQDVSTSGKRAGLAGKNSGLWREFARLIGEVRPRFVLVENTTGLLSLGMGDVLGDLAALGYNAEWECISAGAIGAPHERDRVWIFAYPNDQSKHTFAIDGKMAGLQSSAGNVAQQRCSTLEKQSQTEVPARFRTSLATAFANRKCREWPPEPNVVRVVDGLSKGLDAARIRHLGNAVVPQIPEIIGRAIMEIETS